MVSSLFPLPITIPKYLSLEEGLRVRSKKLNQKQVFHQTLNAQSPLPSEGAGGRKNLKPLNQTSTPQKMNYIKHLTAFFDKVILDKTLNPTHISLYIALFQCWNCNRFRNPISINRDEIMRISKISSKATYHKCLKNLHAMGYINYEPSFNPFRGSHVILFNFAPEQMPIPMTDEPTSPFFKQHTETASEQLDNLNRTKIETSPEQVLVPSINNRNSTNDQNSENKTEKLKKSEIDFPKEKEIEKKIIHEKKFRQKTKTFIEPNLEETVTYFKQQQYPDSEAKKFFNYFVSIGWLVGGKTPMVNWEAAANSWMLNTQNTSAVTNTITNPVPGNLKTSNENKYDEPL